MNFNIDYNIIKLYMKSIIYLIVILTVIFILYKFNTSLLSWWFNKIPIKEGFSGKRNDKNDKKYKCSVKPNKEYGTYDAFTLTPAQKAKTQDAFPGKSPKFWACKQACKSRDRETGAPIKGECIPIGDVIMKDIVDITAPPGYTPHADKTIKFLTSENEGAHDKTLKNQSSLENAIKNAFPNREDFDTKVWALEWNEKLKIANFRTKKADGMIPGTINGFSLKISPGWRSFVNTSKSGHGSQIIVNYIGGWEESLATLWKGIKDVNYKSISTSDCKKACEDEEECLGYQTGYIKKDGKAECILVNSWKNPGRDFKLRNGRARSRVLNSKSYIKVVDLYYKDIVRLNNEFMIEDWRDPERTIYKGRNESGYRGYQTKTKSGKTCQSWQNHSILSKNPRRRIDATNMIDYGGDQKKSHNYCRNPVPNNDPTFGTLKLFSGNGACQKGGCNSNSCPSPYKCQSINGNQCNGSGNIYKTYTLRSGSTKTLDYNNMVITRQSNNKLYAKINGRTLSVSVRRNYRDTKKFPGVASSTTTVRVALKGSRYNYCQDPRWEAKQNEIWCYTSPNSLEKENCLPKYEYSPQSKGEQEGYLAITGSGTVNGKSGFSLWTDKNPNRQGGNSQWQILSAIGKTGPVKNNDIVYLYNTTRNGYDGGYLSLRKELGKNKCNSQGYTASTLKLSKPDSSCKFKIQLKGPQNSENIKTNSKIILTSNENNSLALITCNWIKWHLNRDIAIKSGNVGSSKFWRITPVSSSGLRIGVSNAYKLENEVTDYVFTDTNVDCKNWTEGKIDKTAIASPGINTITKCGDKCNKNEKCKGFYFDPDSKECWMESGFCENTKGNKGHYIKTQVGWCGPEGSNVLATSTFPKCKKECLDNKNCNAIRFIKETGKCNLLRSCATNNQDKNWRNIIFSVKSNSTGAGMAGMQRTKGYEVTNPDDKNIYYNNNNTDNYIKTDKNNMM